MAMAVKAITKRAKKRSKLKFMKNKKNIDQKKDIFEKDLEGRYVDNNSYNNIDRNFYDPFFEGF